MELVSDLGRRRHPVTAVVGSLPLIAAPGRIFAGLG